METESACFRNLGATYGETTTVTEPNRNPENSTHLPAGESAFLWLKAGDQLFVGCLCLLGLSISLGYWSRLSEATEENATGKKHNRSLVYRLDLNTSSQDRLMLLNGIGPTLSQRIVEYREEHGPFETVDDLRRVKGIGPKKLEAIRPFVTVDRRRSNHGLKTLRETAKRVSGPLPLLIKRRAREEKTLPYSSSYQGPNRLR